MLLFPLINDKVLIQYIKNGKKLKGVMIAFTYENNIYVGWSLCHPIDNFSKEKALDVAYNRAVKWRENLPKYWKVPYSIEQMLTKFIRYRVIKYYKDKEIPVWVNTYMNAD